MKIAQMKKLFITLIALLICSVAYSQSTTYVKGYYRKDGTYVSPHRKTTPNKTNKDNYSTSGNYNPYTGKKGYIAPDYSTKSYNYGSGKTIHTGSRGGKYYYNSKGKKTYVPKR